MAKKTVSRRTHSHPPRRRLNAQNTMNFPSALRDALPTISPCWGRALLLTAITGRAVEDPVFSGKRVRVKFEVQETGRLTGKFDVWIDIDPAAEQALARTLDHLARQTESPPAASA